MLPGVSIGIGNLEQRWCNHVNECFIRLRLQAWQMCGRGLLLVLLGCAATSCSVTRSVSHQPNPILRAHSQPIEQAVEQYWTARKSGAWETVYAYQDASIRARGDLATFVAWSQKSEPFRVLDFSVLSVEENDDHGWAHVDYETLLSMFPEEPPRWVEAWQKWHRVDKQWVLVPFAQRSNFSMAPSRRNLTEEPALRRRLDEFWKARQMGNWSHAYEMIDPNERDGVVYDGFATSEKAIEYFSREVHWVEAVGNLGRIYTTYEYRLSDPNLKKLAPRNRSVIEKWILRDGTWYLMRP